MMLERLCGELERRIRKGEQNVLTKKQKANAKRAISKQLRLIKSHFKKQSYPLDYYFFLEEIVDAVCGKDLQNDFVKELVKAQMSLCFIEGKPFMCILPAKNNRVSKKP